VTSHVCCTKVKIVGINRNLCLSVSEVSVPSFFLSLSHAQTYVSLFHSTCVFLCFPSEFLFLFPRLLPPLTLLVCLRGSISISTLISIVQSWTRPEYSSNASPVCMLQWHASEALVSSINFSAPTTHLHRFLSESAPFKTKSNEARCVSRCLSSGMM